MQFIALEARRESEALDEERSVFPSWQRSRHADQGLPLRNATITSIAPTGTISIIADTTSGIEPIFALSNRRVGVLDGQTLVEIKPLLTTIGERLGFLTSDVRKYVEEFGTLSGAPGVPESARDLLATAIEIDPLCVLLSHQRPRLRMEPRVEPLPWSSRNGRGTLRRFREDCRLLAFLL